MIHQIFFAFCTKKYLAIEFNPHVYAPSFWPLAAFLSRVCFPDVVVDKRILEFHNHEYVQGGYEAQNKSTIYKDQFFLNCGPQNIIFGPMNRCNKKGLCGVF